MEIFHKVQPIYVSISRGSRQGRISHVRELIVYIFRAKVVVKQVFFNTVENEALK